MAVVVCVCGEGVGVGKFVIFSLEGFVFEHWPWQTYLLAVGSRERVVERGQGTVGRKVK